MDTTKGDLSAESDSPIGLTGLGRVRVLRVLGEHQQHPRSGIVGRSGLARATVSSIVHELIGAGLVRKSAAGEAARAWTGRPAQAPVSRPGLLRPRPGHRPRPRPGYFD